MDERESRMYESYMELILVDIWVAITGLINLAANGLIIYCLIKSKLRRPVYILIFNISILDIIQQLFCPTVFRIFASIDDIFKDFRNHAFFTCIYFVTLYFVALLMFVLMFRVHCKCIDKIYYIVYGIIGTLWFLAILCFCVNYVYFNSYMSKYHFIPPYFMLLALLLIYVHIHQIMTALKKTEYSGADYQVSVLIVLTFVSSRLIGALFFFLGELTNGLVPLLRDYVILGALQLMSIGNLLIIAKFEDEVAKNLKLLFRRRRTVVVGNEFRSLEEDHTLPE